MLVSLLLTFGFYTTHALKAAQLTQREVSAADYAQVRKHQLRRNIWLAIIGTVGFKLLDWLWSGGQSPVHVTLKDWVQVAIFAVGLFLILYTNSIRNIKRYEE
jgi:cation transport ATPase